MSRLALALGVAGALAFQAGPALAQQSGGAGDQPIYGSQLMTQQERNAFRERMSNAGTQEERERIRAEHHERMTARAKEQGITLPDMPGQRGGKGMGQGQGQGQGQVFERGQGQGRSGMQN